MISRRMMSIMYTVSDVPDARVVWDEHLRS